MKSRNNYAAKIHNALQRYIFLSVNISSIYIFTNVWAYFSSLYENKVVHLHTNTNLLLMPNKKSCEYENNNAVTGCADAQTSSVKVQVPATKTKYTSSARCTTTANTCCLLIAESSSNRQNDEFEIGAGNDKLI
jgi:hypothetical protein